MSDNNEIDDILNEIKNKSQASSNEGKAKDRADDFFYSFTPPPQKSNHGDVESAFEIAQDLRTPVEPKHRQEDNDFDLINDSFKMPPAPIREAEEDMPQDRKKKSSNKGSGKNNKKTIIIAIIAVIVVVAVAITAFALKKKKEKPETTTTPSTTVSTTAAPAQVINPLTGMAGFNKSAVGKRPVACVVENSYYARPQWGIDDKKSPDIIVEGEVEGGESRMLWIFADYTNLPEQIGPMRSARPPYIRFSKLFDSIFVHWGMSTSKGNYVGADSVFKSENVDHINQMSYSGKVQLFGRDSSRGVSSEHTGVLYGAKLKSAIADYGFRTKANDDSYTKFSFNAKATTLGTTKCEALGLKFSSRSNTRDWTYNAEDKLYHSTDYKTDVTRTNLLVLYDETEYVVKQDYKGSGKAETYCDYKLSGGKGKLASLGTIIDVTWSVSNGKLLIKDTSGNEVKFNPGKTWIGYASSNNGGNAKIVGAEESTSSAD